MIEKPNIAEASIIDSLASSYGIAAEKLEFLPIGYDATAWVYRVQAVDGQVFFLKLKKALRALLCCLPPIT